MKLGKGESLLTTGIILAGNLVLAPLSALLVLVWARQSGTPMEALGFVRPRSWMVSIVGGIAFGAAFKVLMKSVIFDVTAVFIIYGDLESRVAYLVFR